MKKFINCALQYTLSQVNAGSSLMNEQFLQDLMSSTSLLQESVTGYVCPVGKNQKMYSMWVEVGISQAKAIANNIESVCSSMKVCGKDLEAFNSIVRELRNI